MNALTIVLFGCLAVFASAKPSEIWAAHGHAAAVNVVPAGPTTLIGASGVVGPHGASGPSGTVNGHGAVGPSGEHNAPHEEAIIAAPIVSHAAFAAPALHAVAAPSIHAVAAPAVVQHSAAVVAHAD
ncbi:hypothetical protein RN001_002580 [Aquatica leii]|uniref:Uncharacterized protein n=1 Tax=Aquatica leii TaxID=1421715 RepID=A0AAN7Q5H5_9COLE|nr:hypothetical protein RN001_002580 [Aquatica leii]